MTPLHDIVRVLKIIHSRVKCICPETIAVSGHIIGTVAVEQADPCLRIQVLDLFDRIVVEGRVNDSVLPVHFLCQREDILFDMIVEDNAGLQFDIDCEPGGRDLLTDLRMS